MTLLLIRHGETEFNAGRVVQFPHTPLGATGRAQADLLGRRLTAQHRIGLVLTSDYTRARQTAGSVVAHTGAPMREHESLRERNLGDHRGTAYADLGDLDLFADGYHPPNGESWEQFHARVDRAWNLIQELLPSVDGDLAVVTHGLVLRSLFQRKVHTGDYVIENDMVVPNTSVTLVERKAPWRVLDLASTTHLDDVARAGGVA